MKIFKFGGASVKDAESVENVATILRQYEQSKVLVVISAMAKTTNLLENLVGSYIQKEPQTHVLLEELKTFHFQICSTLFQNPNHPIFNDLENLFLELECMLEKEVGGGIENYDFVYDQVVSYGELLSTRIVSAYLLLHGIKNKWVDARNFIFTNSHHREAQINWQETERIIAGKLKPFAEKSMVITQGFIGKDRDNATTTLGREGSDYSAAVFAYCLDAESVTIWKDVEGVMNADPKKYPGAVKIDTLSYNQAIELAYYGASVIHPKTIQPLKSKAIPLYVQSFVKPQNPGTAVKEGAAYNASQTCYIFKENQCLLTLKSRDFSFIAENNLQQIFSAFALHKVRINMMQNSAISFKAIIDCDERKMQSLLADLQLTFETRIQKNLRLLSEYNPCETLPADLMPNREVVLEQKSERVWMRVFAL